jgi:hypothetical protein
MTPVSYIENDTCHMCLIMGGLFGQEEGSEAFRRQPGNYETHLAEA